MRPDEIAELLSAEKPAMEADVEIEALQGRVRELEAEVGTAAAKERARCLYWAEQMIAMDHSRDWREACEAIAQPIRDGLTTPSIEALKASPAEPGWDRWIGPCIHGRDPWTRCETCEEAGEVQAIAWALQTEQKRNSELEAQLAAATKRAYEKAHRALLRAEKRADALFKALEATYPPPARDGSKEGA